MARKREHAPERARTGPEAGPAPGWPEDFARPRDVLLAAGCLVAWGGILAVLAAGNSLLGLKRGLLVIAGARLQPLLDTGALYSTDIAVVLFGAMLVIVAGYLHVSIGLAVVLALRPWLDGFTYPADNTYFLWAIFYLAALWGLRQYRNPRPFRGGLPLMLLGLYIVWAALGTFTAVQLNTTLTGLHYWIGYAALLLVATNGTNSAPARAIVVVGLLAGVAGQALFAYPHLHYVLPWIRQALQSNPEMLAQWFQGATEFTPELARRFNLNRAFGSMVFPNALGALLLLGIAPTAALAADGWRRLLGRSGGSGADTSSPAGFAVLIVVAVPLFSAIVLTCFALGLLPLAYRLDQTPWLDTPLKLAVASAIIGAIPTLAFLISGRRHGIGRAALMLQVMGTTVFAPIMIGALWITYSRGSMLALALAVLLVGFLHRMGRGCFPRFRRAAMVSVILASLMGVLAGLGVTPQAFADEPAKAPSNEVSAEGMDVTLGELVNPASFSARLGYWRVALRMAAEYPWTGVGLENFGIAYGPLQDLDAGDVRNAHSVVLQVLCELGLPGLALFLAFWGVFLVRAARVILGGRATLLDTGLITGLGAFLIHALVDINFSHPSLVMVAMATLGLIYGAMPPPPVSMGRDRKRRIGAVVLVLCAAIAAGLVMRPYLRALGMNGGHLINVSARDWVQKRQQVATFLIADCSQWARNGKEGEPPRIPLPDIISIFPERDLLFTLGRVLVFDPGQGAWVAITAGQPLPAGGVVEITRPWDTHFYAMERVERWVQELVFLDARFPYEAELALTIGRMYKLMAIQASTKQAARKDSYLAGMMHWAEEARRRSPLHKDMHENLAWAHWTMASNSEGQQSIDHYMAALQSFQRAQELGHLEPRYYFARASALNAIAQSYENQGLTGEAKHYADEAARVREAGLSLQSARWERGLQ